jgi:hypothetical protein
MTNTLEPQAMGYIRSHWRSEYVVINTKYRPPWEDIRSKARWGYFECFSARNLLSTDNLTEMTDYLIASNESRARSVQQEIFHNGNLDEMENRFNFSHSFIKFRSY